MRPLTPAQLELWTDATDPALWTGAYLDITGPLDAAALCAAIDATVAEDETLRLRFAETPNGPRQWSGPRPDQITSVRTAPDPIADMRADLTADVDLARGPLFRHVVYRLSADRHLWFTRVHHLVHDGQSILITRARTAEHYAALTGASPAGPPLGSYWRLLDEVERYPGSAAYHRDRGHWLRTMAGATPEPRDIPPLTPPPADENWRTAVITAVGGLLGVPMPGRVGARRTPAMLTAVLPLRADGDVASALRRMSWHQRYPTADLRRDLSWPTRWFGPHLTLLDARGPRFGPTRTTGALLSPGLAADVPVITAIRHDDRITIDRKAHG